MKKILYIAMPYEEGKSGISRYIEQTLDRLSGQVEVDLIMMKNDYEILQRRVDNTYNWLELGRSQVWKGPILSIFFHCFILPVYCLFKDFDYVFFPAGNRRFPLVFPLKTITMAHDFAPLHIPGKYDPFRHFYVTKVLPIFLNKANLIFTPSESTKKDLLYLCGINENKIRVNYLGFNFPKLKLEANNKKIKKKFLYVSRVEHPGKNHLSLIKSFEKLCLDEGEKFELHFVGGDWNGAEIVHEYHQQSRFRDKIFFHGHVTDEQLEKEYNTSSVFIYPSFYEGFGLPLLEAMSRGLPVISSDRGSLSEVGGSSVKYINPEDHDDIKSKMKSMINSVDEQQKYIQLGFENLKRFSWEKHVNQFPH